VKFKVTRLLDVGYGVLVPTTGKIALQQKVRGHWKVVKGSRVKAYGGHITLKYYCSGNFKIRAKALSPTTYSKAVRLRF
jgi:hypothetical protein